jgi:hypothetical protein
MVIILGVRLFHLSEDASIARFDPREPPSTDSGVVGPCVWAVDESRLRNYLLPRECPRVTFYARDDSARDDVQSLMRYTNACAVVAIEAAWLERVRATTLYLHELPSDRFECVDRGAGYWISRSAVTPVGVERVDDCLRAIAERNAEIRIVPSLWPLRDAVVRSTLGYSMIRMRNARARGADPAAEGASPSER